MTKINILFFFFQKTQKDQQTIVKNGIRDNKNDGGWWCVAVTHCATVACR